MDRCQVFWARKYRLKLSDPLKATRRGYLLSVAATRGKTLFDGLQLTTKYFFDAIDARFDGSLVYRGIEGPKDMANHPTVGEDVDQAVDALMAHYAARKNVLFLCRRNACRSQMAGALAQRLAGDRFDVSTGGSEPAKRIDPDMARSWRRRASTWRSERRRESKRPWPTARRMRSSPWAGAPCPVIPGALRQDWDVPDPAGKPIEVLRQVRDEIEARVKQLIAALAP